MFDQSKTNEMPFVPQFGSGPLPTFIPPKRVTRFQFTQDAYQDHLARAITVGKDVAILTRAAESIAEGNSLLQAIRNAPSSASLTVNLLDWELAIGREKTLIQNNWALLNGWKVPGTGAALNLLLHDVSLLDVEVTLIGDSELLVAPLREAAPSFSQLRPGDPFFAHRKDQVQEAFNSHQRAQPHQ
jgi:hypothetical protein